ncbi:MAG: folylpolyglutamate synthase/dihydrofolate synthase family protein [Tunicatimonas sp.]
MTYSEAVTFLYQQLPAYQRVGKSAFKADLTNICRLVAHLENPHERFPSVHIAGTNGKGSSAHCLAAVLQSAGYRTGLYTSPHLKTFTERIRIDGQEISEAAVADFVRREQEFITEVSPSFFELTVALAFQHFARQQVDIAVVEVGLGGRLDSTNIITPEVSLITNIDYDHTDLLGETLPEIAGEKAGIIKPGVPVVVGQRHPETEAVFQRVAEVQDAPLFFAEDYYAVFDAEEQHGGQRIRLNHRPTQQELGLFLSLGGRYQRHNLGGVLLTLDKLRERGWRIPAEAVAAGLARVSELTGLRGRWQVLGHRPLCIADTGHNAAAWQQTTEQLRSYAAPQIHLVLGVSQGKDREALLRLLPRDGKYYFCQAPIPRALPAAALAEEAKKHSLVGEVIEDVQTAYEQARQNAQPDDLVWVGGSSFVVAELSAL